MNQDQNDDNTTKVNTLWIAVTDLQLRFGNFGTHLESFIDKVSDAVDEMGTLTSINKNLVLENLELRVRIENLEDICSKLIDKGVKSSWNRQLKEKLSDWLSSTL